MFGFSYNNYYHSSIKMELSETFYNIKCRSSIGSFEVGEVALIGPKLVHDTIENGSKSIRVLL